MHQRWLAAWLVTMVAIGGCANQDDAATPSSNPSSPTSAPNEPSASSPPTNGAQVSARTLVSTGAWPDDLTDAKVLFKRMPQQLVGMSRRNPRFYGAAGVVYRARDGAATAYVLAPTKEVKEPTALLSVMFGMGYGCRDGSFVGTASQSRWGGGPGMDHRNAFDTDAQLWWFACDYTRGGSSAPAKGFALGWVSGKLPWLVTTPDRQTAISLLRALRVAAS